MGTVFNSYSITWSQSWRVIAYHAVLLPLAGLAVGIFKLAAFYGVKLINIVFGHEWLMGEKLTNIVGAAANTVWPQDLFNAIMTACSISSTCCADCSIGAGTLNNFYTCFIPAAPGSLTGTECAAAMIVGLFFLILTLTFFSYFFSILSVGETIMLTIFRKKSDDDNILERKDEEEWEAEEGENDDMDLDDAHEDNSEYNDEPSDDGDKSFDE